jgi:hypothetical protein
MAWEQCGANKKNGEPCEKPKGWGTAHPGFGRRKFHGGANPNGNKAAIREQAASLATEVDIEPNEMLLRTIRLTWAAVQWCANVIGQTEYALASVRNDDDPELDANEKVKRVINLEKRLLALQAVYGDWIDKAKHAKLAVDAGIEERRIQLAEMEAQLVANVVNGVLEDLNLTAEQKAIAPEVVRGRLVSVPA